MTIGKDPQWTKTPAWAKKGDSSIPATEGHVGEGQPAGAAPGTAPDTAGQTAGHPAPAAQ